MIGSFDHSQKLAANFTYKLSKKEDTYLNNGAGKIMPWCPHKLKSVVQVHDQIEMHRSLSNTLQLLSKKIVYQEVCQHA